MKWLFRILSFCLILTLFAGCASIIDLPKKLWGSSIQTLQEARKDGVSQTFNLDYETSFNKVIEILKEMNCYIHIKNKRRHLIVAINFQGPKDTTEVGIFFTPLEKVRPVGEDSLTGLTEKGPRSTKIELSSTSKSVLNYAAERIFLKMKK